MKHLRKIGFGVLFTLLFFGMVELGLRIAGVAEGQQYAPPRLIKVMKDGNLEGEYVQNSEPFFKPVANTLLPIPNT